MDEVQARVDQAHRRLVLEQWLGRAAWCLFWGLCLAAVAVAIPKIFVIENLPESWNQACLAIGAGFGILVSIIWSLVQHTSRDEAAIEIDRRYGLRERIASSMLLSEESQSSEAGAALVRDAHRVASRIEVSEHFGLKLNRWAWLPVAPAVLAFLMMTFLANRTAESGVKEPDQVVATEEEIKKSIEEARKRLAERRKKAEEKGLTDATKLLKQVEQGAQELANKPQKDQTKAVVKLNDLAKKLEQKRAELGSAEALRKQMKEMKDLGKGPADKVAEAMKEGDWKKALNELKKMQQQVADGKLSPEKQQQLAEQLGKMQQKLSQAAKQQKQQMADVKRQMEEARRKGDLAQASKLQQKLDQMQQQQPQMNQMQQMAQQMAKAQEAIKNGDPQQAAEAMQQMAQQMQQMQKQNDAMEMLDAALTDIQQSKDSMCACNKPGQQMGQPKNGMGQAGKGQGQKPGNGMGEGRGKGFRPDEEHATNFRDMNVKQNVTQGASTFGGLVHGPSIKGEVAEQVKEGLNPTHVAPADPLTSERLPRSRQEHAEEYFNKLREAL